MVRGRRGKDSAASASLPTTAYLMEGDRCSRDCAFCPQARTASSRDDLLARVNWPEVAPEPAPRDGTGPVPADEEVAATDGSFWSGLAQAADDRRLRRACFQLTASPGVMAKVERQVRKLHRLRPSLPICVSVAARDVEEIGRVLGWGAERVTVALDAATPEVYRATKGGPFEPRLAILLRGAERYPGRIGTHIIAGLGETERDLVGLFGVLADAGITVALFAFTPVPGTRLEGRHPPDLDSYRRIQAARYLICGGYVRAESMTFDGLGRLSSYGLPWNEVLAILAGGRQAAAIRPDAAGGPGQAFRTSGCPDCNRPYYNERPSGPLYNYPRPLTAEEVVAATEKARPCTATDHPAAPRARGPGGPRPEAQPVWRLVVEESPRTGAENMAVDEAILLAHAAGKVPPTLRFYRWDPPAVSLGYFQDYATEVDPAACRQAGIEIVRRATGGRAVLHDREVTYSVIVSMEMFPGTVVETYRRLAAGLVLGLRELGVDATLAPERTGPGAAPDARRPGGACFEVPSSYEIVAGGKKVVGSAQVRRHGVILQHGSILLELRAELLAHALGLGPEAATRIVSKAAGLAQLRGGHAPGYAEVCQAVAQGIGEAVEVRFAAGGLTADETATAERLVKEKYGQDGWNARRPPLERDAGGIAGSGSGGGDGGWVKAAAKEVGDGGPGGGPPGDALETARQGTAWRRPARGRPGDGQTGDSLAGARPGTSGDG